MSIIWSWAKQISKRLIKNNELVKHVNELNNKGDKAEGMTQLQDEQLLQRQPLIST